MMVSRQYCDIDCDRITTSIAIVSKIFAAPITNRASAVVVAHNHPSGGLSPSKEDIEITHRLRTAGETLGIKLLDHIIFNRTNYCSLLEQGLL